MGLGNVAAVVDAELLANGRVRVETAGPVLTVTLDRPEQLNAQTPATWRALAAVGADAAGRRPGRRAAWRRDRRSRPAWTGRCSPRPGLPGEPSLLGLAALPDAELDAAIAGFQAAFTWWSQVPAVTVAAVQGNAIGAGFQLALACDLRVVADDARFAMKETSLGLVPDLAGTWPLVASVGYARALGDLRDRPLGRRGGGGGDRAGHRRRTRWRPRRHGGRPGRCPAGRARRARCARPWRCCAGAATRTPGEQQAAERAAQARRLRRAGRRRRAEQPALSEALATLTDQSRRTRVRAVGRPTHGEGWRRDVAVERVPGDARPDPRRQRRGPAAQAGHDPTGVRLRPAVQAGDRRLPAPGRPGLGPDRRRPADPEVDRRQRRDAQGHPRRRRAGPDRGRHRDRGRGRRAGPALVLRPGRRGPDLRPAHRGLRARAAAADRVLHPHPDRLAGLPDQQRRDGRAAGVHLDPVRRRLQRRLAGARRRRDVLPVLADHRDQPAAGADLPAPGALHGPPAGGADPAADAAQRRARRPDHRAVQRRRCVAGQAVRPPGRGGAGVPRARRRRPRRRHQDRHEQPGLLHLAAAGGQPGDRGRLRRGRRAGRPRRLLGRHAAGPGRADVAGSTARSPA